MQWLVFEVYTILNIVCLGLRFPHRTGNILVQQIIVSDLAYSLIEIQFWVQLLEERTLPIVQRSQLSFTMLGHSTETSTEVSVL